jgi:hypothetical protein
VRTEVRGVRYDVARRTGQLHMPDGCCCDMQACIDFFESIDSHVDGGPDGACLLATGLPPGSGNGMGSAASTA